MSNDILKKRIKQIKKSDTSGECVLYVMSRDQRVRDNHALLAAQKHALAKNLPLAVVFNLLTKTGYRSKEHYEFMIEGLQSVQNGLSELNIPFIVRFGSPKEQIGNLIKELSPDAVYFDFSPLRGPQKVQKGLAEEYDVSMYVVDTHNIVPVWQVSDKQEVAAYTLRPKLHKSIEQYLVVPDEIIPHPTHWVSDIDQGSLLVALQSIVTNIKPSGIKIEVGSGEKAAAAKLNSFIDQSLVRYVTDCNDPTVDGQSGLSPYLHFGQLSALRVAFELRNISLKSGNDIHIVNSSKMPKGEEGVQASIDALLEELIVRKELADNYCYYNENYDSIEGAPDWAKMTLDEHRNEPREYVYSYEHIESAQTHDPAWNAAQTQMRSTGKMHGYMRMYWAKKVLEWTESPEQANEYLIRLNDTYSIDGGDPNGYAGIMWSVCGVHDRPWVEREVFGKIRYMNYGGLKRKFDIDHYQNTWL